MIILGKRKAIPRVPYRVVEQQVNLSDSIKYKDKEGGVVLFQANCLHVMDSLYARHPGGIFDMIFADPPYFLSNGGISCHAGKRVKVDKGAWDRSRGLILDHKFNIAWLTRCRRLLKPNGTIWVSGTHHGIHSVGFAMQQLGMIILNHITWEKPNPPPNLACRCFTHSTETIIWAKKYEQSKHCFNYREMKQINDGKQMKSVWTMTAPKKDEKIQGKHPAQKPLSLLRRIILASTNAGDLILDPFSGSSTTGVAAIELNRKYVGIELESEFVDLSIKRLKDAMGRRGDPVETE